MAIVDQTNNEYTQHVCNNFIVVLLHSKIRQSISLMSLSNRKKYLRTSNSSVKND